MTPGEAAREALERYRRGAARRGEAVACLVGGARRLEREGLRRRRSEVVERAVRESGLGWEEAQQVYDVAHEEGVEPALALELLHCGVLVRAPEEEAPSELERDTVLEATPPEWLAGPPPEETEARWESRLRGSFRRLRRLLREHPSPEEALVAFTEEPDVAPPD